MTLAIKVATVVKSFFAYLSKDSKLLWNKDFSYRKAEERTMNEELNLILIGVKPNF
jgi:hypothetical protein